MNPTANPDGRTICHRLPSELKLGLAAGVILAGVTIPATSWPALGVLGCLVFAAHSFAATPLRYLIRRVLLFLPWIGSMAVSLPLSQGLERGWELMLTIFLRGMLAFTASLWLMQVLPFPQLLRTLRRLHVPLVLVAILAFMERYIFVVWEELDTLRTAWRARSFGPTGLWFRWHTLAQLLGQLLIRSLTRAERIHRAMLARGWTGAMPWLDMPETAPAASVNRTG